MLKVLRIYPDTAADGPGNRTSIYFAGCRHKCKGCHNPESWNFDQGDEYEPEELAKKALSYGNKKITLSGGDPLYQKDLIGFLKCLRNLEPSVNVWCYTGFCVEDLTFRSLFPVLACLVDVFVDGPFVESLKDTSLQFRGSSNQKIVCSSRPFLLWGNSKEF